MQKSLRAFTLIEFSMVILIIGFLLTGTIVANSLIQKSKLASARAQTLSSVVVSTKGLVAWWEATSEKSFKDTETEDGAKISLWYDINPLSTKKFSAAQNTSGNQPIYKSSAINNLPALKFNGTTSYLEAAYDFNLNPSAITVFAVVKTSATTTYGTIISSRNDPPHCGYMLYSAPNSPIDYEAWFGDGASSWGTGSTPHSAIILEKPTIISLTNSGSTMSIYNNGTSVGSAGITMTQNSVMPLRIGAGKNETTADYFYNGYIGELIVFKRVLSDEERKMIEDYLSKKWGM